jgi:glycerol-3-phosphate responsive antiterminator
MGGLISAKQGSMAELYDMSVGVIKRMYMYDSDTLEFVWNAP